MAGKTAAERKRDQRARDRAAAELITGDELEPREIDRPCPPNPAGGEWWPETVDLWNAVVETQIAQRMIETDWQWLAMVLPLVNDYWGNVRDGDTKQAAALLTKLRVELGELGATPKARHQLKWHFLPPGATPKKAEQPEPVDVGTGDANVVSIHKLTGLGS